MVSTPQLKKWILSLVDPFLTTPLNLRDRLRKMDLALIRAAFAVNVVVWPLIYIAHYHINDAAKQPLGLYFKYRYGMAAAIWCLGLLGYVLRGSAVGLRLCLLVLASLTCYVQAWSMTLGPYIPHSYLVWLPLIVLASFSRSYLLSAAWLVFLVYTSKYFWASYTDARSVFSDTCLGLLLLFGVLTVRKFWLESQAMQLLNKELHDEKLAAALGELTAKNKLSTIASQVAHDIRSPLAVLEIALRDVKNTSHEQRDMIDTALRRIKAIAADLLKEGRDVRKLKSEPAQSFAAIISDINGVVKKIVAEKEFEFANRKGLSFKFSSSMNNEKCSVKLDEARFARCLSNLINNAAEAMGYSGSIDVVIAAIMDKCLVSVSDSGCGIPAALLEKLDQPGMTFGKADGNGLGLSFVHSCMIVCGGELKIESDVGRGTSVTMILPRA